MSIPATTAAEPGLYVLIGVPLPDRIADRLPSPREGVRPHITLAGPTCVAEGQARRILGAFRRGDIDSPGQLGFDGVGDFRSDDPPTPVVYLRIVDGADRLVKLAAELDDRFGLSRRFTPYYPHVTLRYWVPDEELDAVAAEYAGYAAECEVDALTLTMGTGTVAEPYRITWGPLETYHVV